MTKITHYISSITQRNEFAWVKFKEIVSNGDMKKYLEDAQKSWTNDGFEGNIPLDTLVQLREQRFKNEFQMKFPFYEWCHRNLQIYDKVVIDMPLQLSDITLIDQDSGK